MGHTGQFLIAPSFGQSGTLYSVDNATNSQEPDMARETNTESTTSGTPDYATLLADLAALRAEVTRLASETVARASVGREAMAEGFEQAMHDARSYAGRKSHEADASLHQAVTANPYLALGIAAGIGLLLGALSRR
jgi:ElaB/YqjD/DUF883 family membrane-anchored ribosome-binding protein